MHLFLHKKKIMDGLNYLPHNIRRFHYFTFQWNPTTTTTTHTHTQYTHFSLLYFLMACWILKWLISLWISWLQFLYTVSSNKIQPLLLASCWVQASDVEEQQTLWSFHEGCNNKTIREGKEHIDGLVQDCSISSMSSMEILQSCIKPLISAPSFR